MSCVYLFLDYHGMVKGNLAFPAHLPAWSVAPLIGLPRLFDLSNRLLTGDERIGAWADRDNVVWVTTGPPRA